MQRSESIANIAKALAAAQGEMKPPVTNSTAKVRMKAGGEYSYKYADLATVWEASKTALTKHGIAVIQVPDMVDGVHILDTMLMHESGEWISGRDVILPVENTPQAYGSALTYIRRYSLSAMVMQPPEDDDGAAASAGEPNGATKKAKLEAVPDKPKEQPPENKAAKKNPTKLTASGLWERTKAAEFTGEEFREVALYNLALPEKLTDCTDAHLKRWANWLESLEKKVFSKEEALMLAANNKNLKEATA